MRAVVIQASGMAGAVLSELSGKSPLETANTPTLDSLGAHGILGLAATTEQDHLVGSVPTTLALLGYPPESPILTAGGAVAAAHGVELADDEMVALVDLVGTRSEESGTESAATLAGLHLPPDARRAVVQSLAETLGDTSMRLHVGLRPYLVAKGEDLGEMAPPPWTLLGRPVSEWRPDGGGRLAQFAQRARQLLAAHPACLDARAQEQPVPTDVWVWGHGRPTTLPSFSERREVAGRVVAADPIVLGIGKLVGLETHAIDVSSLAGMPWEAYLTATRSAVDAHPFTLVHLTAIDEAGHRGDAAAKVQLIERLESELIVPLLETFRAMGGDWRLLLVADHATPCDTRKHTTEPVPFLLASGRDAGRQSKGKRRFHERDARAHGVFIAEAHHLMDRILRR